MIRCSFSFAPLVTACSAHHDLLPWRRGQEYMLTDEDYNPIWAASQWKTYGENIAEREKDLAPGTAPKGGDMLRYGM